MDDHIQTRTTLINRLKNWRDQSSWQEFFDTYWKLIYGVARKTGLSDAESQDVVQETMLSVAKQMPTFRYDRSLGSFKAWLLKMTRWRVIDQVRKRGNFGSTATAGGNHSIHAHTLEGIVDPAGGDLDKLWDAEWQKTLVEAAFARVKLRLDPEKFQIYDFYVTKGWAAEKVAEKFGISTDLVYTAKCRISEMIRDEVERLDREMT